MNDLNLPLIVQSLISLIVLVTVCILVLTGQQIPDNMAQIVSIVVAFYFASRSSEGTIRATAKAMNGGYAAAAK